MPARGIAYIGAKAGRITLSQAQSIAVSPMSSFMSKAGQWIWGPTVSLVFFILIMSIAGEFQYIKENHIEILEAFSWFLEPTTFGKLLFSIAVILIARNDIMPGPIEESDSFFRFDLFRTLLAAFFFLYAWVVAQSMIPLQDQAPRIEFNGILGASLGLVIAWHCLTTRFRIFLVGSCLFSIWVAFPQLEKKLRFLEMMLEPLLLEKVTYYGLGVVMLVMLTPKALSVFNRSTQDYTAKKPLFFGNFPF